MSEARHVRLPVERERALVLGYVEAVGERVLAQLAIEYVEERVGYACETKRNTKLSKAKRSVWRFCFLFLFNGATNRAVWTSRSSRGRGRHRRVWPRATATPRPAAAQQAVTRPVAPF